MPVTTMTSSIVDSLRRSNKGQLTYHRDLTLDGSHPKIRKPNPGAVFRVSSIKIALEAIEDDALSFEENSKIRKIANYGQDSGEIRDSFYESNPPINTFANESEKCFTSYDAEVHEETRKSDMIRIRKKEAFYNDLNKKAEIQLAKSKQKQRERAAKAQADNQNYEKQCEDSALKIKRDSQEQHAQLLKTRLQEQEERRLNLQLFEKQREEEGRKRFSQALECMEEVQLIHRRTMEDVGSFQHQDALSRTKVPPLLENGKILFTETSEILSACMARTLMGAEELEKVKLNLEMMKKLQSEFSAEMTSIRTLIEMERVKTEQAKQQAEAQQKLAVETAEAERLKAAQASNPEFNAPSIPKEYKFCVSASAYQKYISLKEKMSHYEECGRELTKSSDRQIKKLAMDLSKVISVPVSSITDRSGSDLKSKLRILTGLLKGQSVTSGNRSVSINSHPQALKFSTNLIAKKIVQQADEQVSSNFTTAFCLALAVLGAWAESNDFGDLFLGHLHSRCAYTIPFYIPKGEKQSDEEHQKMLGYQVADDGTVEGQDKYLKRMSGLVRLYAAVIQSPLPPGISKHPHGLANGWAWLARMLNLEPYPDISATVLYDFLEVAGHALMKSYGRQFEKLLYTICHDYFPKIEEVSGLGQRAPLIRLKNFLEKCIKQKSVPMPKGRLDKHFWNTYHSGEVVGE